MGEGKRVVFVHRGAGSTISYHTTRDVQRFLVLSYSHSASRGHDMLRVTYVMGEGKRLVLSGLVQAPPVVFTEKSPELCCAVTLTPKQHCSYAAAIAAQARAQAPKPHTRAP